MSDQEPVTSRGAAEIERWIRTELGARVGIDPSRFSPHERFNRYGLDSAKAAAFTVDLSKYLGRHLPPTLVWDHPSIERLVHFLTSAPVPRPAAAPRAAPTVSSPRAEPIAIVGMSCRLPGAPDLDAYWRLVAGGVDAIRQVPASRWDIDALFDADVRRAGKMNTRWGGFLDDIDRFDAEAFGISPREAAQIDPQQRLALELAWEAFEDAGVRLDRLKGSATAVFIGAMWSDYARLTMGDLEAITQHSATGQDTSIIPARVSYFFGLQGPSIAVNTACSSSLVAVHLACQSIRSGEAGVALAGGVSLVLAPDSTVAMSKFGAMAEDGRSKAFDARANGYVRGEGGGLIVLKALSRAIADGDRVYCVIPGSAVNNDGFSNGLTAPNPQAQEEVLRLAYARSGIQPSDVQYVEAHGTGTLLGDPIEAGALGAVLGACHTADRPLVIGSVKTNIGHLEAAAGIAGLIKVALSISKRQLPPSLHFDTPNPHIHFDDWHLRVQSALSAWPVPGAPAIAGVSSFGFGGTNAHVVLMEAAADKARWLPIGAGDGEQLKGAAAESLAALESIGASPDLDAFCRTVAAQSERGPARAAVMFRSREELSRRLRALAAGETVEGVLTGTAATPARKLLFVCSGHGSQWPGMGRGLLRSEPVFRAKFLECDAVFREAAGWSLVEELLVDPAASRMSETDIAQPLIFALQVSLAALLQSWGIVADGVTGHSVGEVAAAHIAGILSLEDAARLIVHRSRLLTRTAGRGALAVLGLSRVAAEKVLDSYRGRLWVAACNGPASTVVSGEVAAVHEVLAKVSADGTFARLVNADFTSHTPLVDPYCAEFLENIRDVDPQREALPMFSTVTGTLVAGRELTASYWIRNLRQPVLFEQAVREAARAGYGSFLELSGHGILLSPTDSTISDENVDAVVLGSLRRDEDDRTMMLECLGKLYVRGHSVNKPAAQRPLTVLLSAHSQDALPAAARSLAAFVREREDVTLADLSYTTTVRRTPLERRFAAVADSRATLLDQLEAFADGEMRAGVSAGVAAGRPTLVAVFCGQGAQHPGMGLELVQSEPEFRRTLEHCDALFRKLGGWSLLAELASPQDSGRLNRTEIAQPATFAIQVALAALWRSWGVVPDAVLGHSMGEVAAAHVAGVLSLEEAATVIFNRGRIIQQGAGPGRMAVVDLGSVELKECLAPYVDRVGIAAINSRSSSVISGEPDAIENIVRDLTARGVFCRELRVEFASHSPQMDPLQAALRDALTGLAPRPGRVPLFSTVTGTAIEPWEMDSAYWGRNLRNPVLFEAAVAATLEREFTAFLEIGPHPILKGPIAECARDRGTSVTVIGSLRREHGEAASMLQSAGALHVIGSEINWLAVAPAEGSIRSLTAYPWQRSRHWIDAPARSLASATRQYAVTAQSTESNGWIYDVVWQSHKTVPAITRCAPPLATPDQLVVSADDAHDAATEGLRCAELASTLNSLSVQFVVAALGSLGLVLRTGERFSTQELADRLGVSTSHRNLLGRILEMLAEDGILVRTGARMDGNWAVSREISASNPHAACVSLALEYPEYATEVGLLDSCASRLTEVLRGECDPLDLLFPGGSMVPAEKFYEQSRFSLALNRKLRSAVATVAAHTPADRCLRILEIGGGTGSTTSHVLSVVPQDRTEYTFTDVSPIFLTRARDRFADKPWVRYRQLDIEIDPVTQNFEEHAYDLVIAANVLHATADLRQTLGRVRELLAPGGLLLLIEGTSPTRWVDLIFGMTPGWWKFSDHQLRPNHPLLDRRAWTGFLEASGFADARSWVEEPASSLFPQALIVAKAAEDCARKRWVVFADRGGVGRAIAELLRARSEECVVTSIESDSPDEYTRFFASLDPDRDDVVLDLRALDDAAAATGGERLSDAAVRASSRVLHLTKALAASGRRARLWLLTQDAQPGSNRPMALAQSPVWGLGKVIGLEHPELWGGLIDLEAQTSSDDLASVLDYVRAGYEDQVAWRNGRPHVLRLVPAPARSQPDTPIRLSPDASYLITGGSGKLGLKVAQWMVHRGARHLILVSRRGTVDPAVLGRLQTNGVNVTAAAVDVRDAAAVGALFDNCETAGHPIRGVVHAAGTSTPRLLAKSDRSTIESEFGAKVGGAWVLHAVTLGRALDFFVMFSSASSVWGARERGAYSAANHFLDSLAHERRRLGLPALSINWGRWDAVGVADQKEQAFWDRIGLTVMPEDAALGVMERLIADGSVQRLVARVQWDVFKEIFATRRARPLLEHVTGTAGLVPEPVGAAVPDDLLERLGKAAPDERPPLIAERVGREVARILGVDPSKPLDSSRGFSQMGLDSLMALELRHRLQDAFGLSLPATAVFNYPTVSALAGYLGDRFGVQAAARPEAQDSIASPALDDLSDQDAEALLASRLAALSAGGTE